MDQLLKTFFAFMLIPLMLKLKLKLSLTIVITALIMFLISGAGIRQLIYIVQGMALNAAPRDTILTVFMVSVVGGTMKHYGLLDRVIQSLIRVIPSKKIVLLMVPSLIGTLTIPGGAVLSAPFVDNIGRDIGVRSSDRAAINLIFRHIAMLVFPFSSVILFVRSAMPQINIYLLILYNLVFLLITLTFAYFLYLNKIVDRTPRNKDPIRRDLKDLAFYTSPIYIPVLLNAVFGLAFYLGLLLSLVIVFLQSDRKAYLKVLQQSANWSTVIIIFSVLMIKDIILTMQRMLAVFDQVFSSTSSMPAILGLFMVTSIFFGMTTGTITAPLAITFPMLSQLSQSAGTNLAQLHVLSFFLLLSAFFGYYFSPLHLCQTFTLDIMHVKTGELYKTYIPYALGSVTVLVITTLSLLAVTR